MKTLFVAIIIVIFALPAFAQSPRVVVPVTLDELLWEPATELELRIVDHQLSSCSRGAAKSARHDLVLALWRLEGHLGVPREARGLLGAIWCWETGFSAAPPVGDNGRSHGPLQMMGWFWNWCGHPISSKAGAFLPRRSLERTTHDVLLAATCFWRRVEYFLADGACPGNVWRAEAMTAHAPKYKGAGCGAESLHAIELTRWKTLALQAERSDQGQSGIR